MSSEWVLSVSQLNEYVRKSLSGDPMLRALRVKGEISGFKRHYSGHMYFNVKDEQSRVQCVMFRQNAEALDFEPKDGMQVILLGQASLYTATGSFQIYCEEMERAGAGELYLRFEALKKKLADEGLFDPARKKPLPFLPESVGIVTSRTGAALRDMIRVISRRCPTIKIVLCHAAVQGQSAADEIASAIGRLNAYSSVDVILCGRGGGSIEELWAFNEEKVARAIASSKIPVISCVGHETDFTIADFVSDVRAATPSVGAELAVPVMSDIKSALISSYKRLYRAQASRLEIASSSLGTCLAKLGSPIKILIEPRRARLMSVSDRLYNSSRLRLDESKSVLKALESSLQALNPQAVLKRGYALIASQRGCVNSVLDMRNGMKINIRLRDGIAGAVVENITLEACNGVKEEA